MQSLASLSSAIYRIVFRRGSPQRVHFSQPRLLWGGLAMFIAAVVTQLTLLQADALDAGVLVFVLVTGLAIASALLTWKVPRTRLLPTLLAGVLILAAGFVLLMLAGLLPFPLADSARSVLLLLVGIAVLVGLGNSLQFALKTSRLLAFAYAALFGIALLLLYTTLTGLLAVVFA